MLELASYDDAIVYTFRKRAVRSAILIDDNFPTFQDLLNPEIDVQLLYKESSEALNLYSSFHKDKILCDIENNLDNTDLNFIDKVRKSDLIILDWNFKGDDGGNAIRILDGLSSSPHFNLVVIYTSETDLNKIWTQTAVQLRGGWKSKDELAEKHSLGTDFEDILDSLKTHRTQEFFGYEILNCYILEGLRATLEKLDENFKNIFITLNIQLDQVKGYTEILIHDFVKNEYIPIDKTISMIQGNSSSESRYLLCGGVFVAFKVKNTEANEDTENIFTCLDAALKSWQPNLLQLLISEIQNILEQESYASVQDFMPSDALKIGWLYHTQNTDNISLTLTHRLIDRIKDSFSSEIFNMKSDFQSFSYQAERLIFAVPSVNQIEKLAKAKDTSRVSKIPQNEIIFHALNEYLSSYDFFGNYPTTGTIFYMNNAQGNKTWYVCVSPSCDMELHINEDQLSWHKHLYPFKPMNLLLLEEINNMKPLKIAEQGRHVFITLENKEYYLSAIDATTNQPRPLTVFLDDVKEKNGLEPNQFKIYLAQKVGDEFSFSESILHACKQLRPEYADRFLNFAGNHQSRVGVDFVNLPKE